MASSFAIAGVQVTAGEKVQRLVEVTSRPSGLPIHMPLMLAQSQADGPVLCVVSGVHGDEYEGGAAISRVWNELQPESMKGTFVGVPTINLPALESGTRTSPIDGLNLNRIFPGNASGGVSDRIAHFTFNEIAMKCDYLIDFHGGGIDLEHASVVNYRVAPDPALVDTARRFAESAGLPVMVHGYPGTGQLVDDVIKAGKPSINIETGGGGNLDERAVGEDVTAMRNVMKHLGMIDGEPVQPQRRLHVKDVYQVRVQHGGTWHRRPHFSNSSYVQAGEVIGTVVDVFRNTVETVTVPEAGYLYVYRWFPKIQAGDWVAFVGRETETEDLA
jgi:uncharacterized protein